MPCCNIHTLYETQPHNRPIDTTISYLYNSHFWLILLTFAVLLLPIRLQDALALELCLLQLLLLLPNHAALVMGGFAAAIVVAGPLAPVMRRWVQQWRAGREKPAL